MLGSILGFREIVVEVGEVVEANRRQYVRFVVSKGLGHVATHGDDGPGDGGVAGSLVEVRTESV